MAERRVSKQDPDDWSDQGYAKYITAGGPPPIRDGRDVSAGEPDSVYEPLDELVDDDVRFPIDFGSPDADP